MDHEEQSRHVVDPEIRAFVFSLVSALGGTGADEDGRYVLGDDALACLKDLKKWLRLHDQKHNRLDVARCLAEANLVPGDLLQILASWPETATEDRFKSKIALACMELLVPLTWPMEKNDAQMTVNHHRHIPFLQLAQLSYKRAILEHNSGLILRTCVRIALPSIALQLRDRTPRDEGIIKLLLYFCRNMAMISEPRGTTRGIEEGTASRSSTIEAFRDQEVLALLLTLASNMGEDFTDQDVIVLDVLFHLLKGIDVEKLFMEKKKLDEHNGNELKSLLTKEANMHRSYARVAPSRHNRFGTMIWVKRDDAGRHSTVSGQDVLKDEKQALTKMDQTKRWNRPKRLNQDGDAGFDRFDLNESLTEDARIHLRSFVEEFLDSSFNPLFNHIRRAIEREAERVLDEHKQQFFYLISWFLEAERVRRKNKKETEKQKKDQRLGDGFEADSFALIASVLTQESFVLLNRYMQDRLDFKAWREVQAGIRCFTQILLIVQDMAGSPLEEDQEIAENIQNRIFYEETTHDRIVAILRGYKEQGFGYLDSCTELSHVFLRMLERYSREHVDLQIRSRRRAKKKAAPQPKESNQQGENEDEDEDEESEMEEVREAERTSRERQFDFKRFSAKFTTQACVDTFVLFLKYYNDLSTEQLKRAHRYFYRVAFKQELSVMLFRLDIIALFNKVIKGPDGLDPKSPSYKEWEELVRQVIKKLMKNLDHRPQLIIELLFSKINATVFFLENGYEKQTISNARAPATLEVRGNFTADQRLGIVVTVLRDANETEILEWLLKTLKSAADERQSWEAEAAARRETSSDTPADSQSNAAQQDSQGPSVTIIPSSEPIRVAMFKNARLRLLMTLCGFERLGIEDVLGTTWTVPSSNNSSELRHLLETIQHYRDHPFTDFGNPDVDSAEHLLRRKPTESAKRAEYDDDSDGSLGIAGSGDEFLFPAGGPTNTVDRKQNALDLLKKRRRQRRRSDDEAINPLDEEQLEARRRARAQAELERRRKIKSEEFIRESDEDSDDERDQDFFTREEARRKGQRNRVMEALAAGRVKDKVPTEGQKSSKKTKKRKRTGQTAIDAIDATEAPKRSRWTRDGLNLSSDDDDMDIDHDLPPVPPESVDGLSSQESDGSESEGDDQSNKEKDTPLSSPPHLSKQGGADDAAREAGTGSSDSSQVETSTKTAALTLHANDEVDEEEDDDPVAVAGRRRPRAVFEDSDDE